MSDEKRAGDVIKAKKRELEKTVGEAVLQFCISTGLRISNIDVALRIDTGHQHKRTN